MATEKTTPEPLINEQAVARITGLSPELGSSLAPQRARSEILEARIGRAPSAGGR